MDFTIVIPARNEEVGITTCIASALGAAGRVSGATDILVVDDASCDETVARAEAAGARVLRHGWRKGSLAAWATGVTASEHPIVVFVDADCTVASNAFEELLTVLDRPDVGVVSGRAVPVDDADTGGTPGSAVVTRSARFSAVLLDEVKSRLGDHDFVAVGRLMAIRTEAWNVPSTTFAHCDRIVASAARRAGWRAVWVPSATVFYNVPASYSELRADWQRTRLALAKAPYGFDVVPRWPQFAATLRALRSAPVDGLCWALCRVRLVGERFGRRGTSEGQPVSWG